MMTNVRGELHKLVRSWHNIAPFDIRDAFPYAMKLDELLFHGDLRYNDYLQFSEEGPFPVRLKKWLDNVNQPSEKQALFHLVCRINFIDRSQMLALHRDAYRRIIAPWVIGATLTPDTLLSPDYERNVRVALRRAFLCSITESLSFDDFLNVNSLAGLPKPIILGENEKKVAVSVPKNMTKHNGVIILEDFVGTGKQAAKVIRMLRSVISDDLRILFVPLVVLERGLLALAKAHPNVTIEPVLVIHEAESIAKTASPGEDEITGRIRSIIKKTSKRVQESLHTLDDPPSDPFGYKGSGALVVASHNTPNNTLPIIHHKSPDWFCLFRRLHHSKDGLS
jgi:hypothetical protein